LFVIGIFESQIFLTTHSHNPSTEGASGGWEIVLILFSQFPRRSAKACLPLAHQSDSLAGDSLNVHRVSALRFSTSPTTVKQKATAQFSTRGEIEEVMVLT
jgi:hypothetical protein